MDEWENVKINDTAVYSHKVLQKKFTNPENGQTAIVQSLILYNKTRGLVFTTQEGEKMPVFSSIMDEMVAKASYDNKSIAFRPVQFNENQRVLMDDLTFDAIRDYDSFRGPLQVKKIDDTYHSIMVFYKDGVIAKILDYSRIRKAVKAIETNFSITMRLQQNEVNGDLRKEAMQELLDFAKRPKQRKFEDVTDELDSKEEADMDLDDSRCFKREKTNADEEMSVMD